MGIAAPKIIWHGKAVQRTEMAVMQQRVLQAGLALKAMVQANLSRGMTRIDGPSDPGEYPHREKSRLFQTIFNRPVMSPLSAESQIGTNLDYGVWHELTDRPFLVRTLAENKPAIRRILIKGR